MKAVVFDDDVIHRVCEVLTDELDKGVCDADRDMLKRMSEVYALNSPSETDTHHDHYERQVWDDVAPVKRALTDVTDAGLDRALGVLGDVAERTCDVETLRHVLDRGVNPFALHMTETVLVLGSGLRSMSVMTTDGLGPELSLHLCLVPRFSNPIRLPWDHAEVQLAPSVWWDGRDLSIEQGLLPSTVVACARGRALSDIIRQPALDLIGLRIASIEETETGVTLLTDREVTPITWREARCALKGRTP